MNTKLLQNGENYGQYIDRRIEEIFSDLASESGEQFAKEYGVNMPAGALAFDLMDKSMRLQSAWKKIAESRNVSEARL